MMSLLPGEGSYHADFSVVSQIRRGFGEDTVGVILRKSSRAIVWQLNQQNRAVASMGCIPH